MSISSRFAILYLALTLGLTLCIAWIFPKTLPAVDWIAAVNLITLLAYGFDKAIAGSGQMRVPEVVLLGLALCGGSPAALIAMRLFHHKTAKMEFQVRFWAIAGLQAVLVIGYILFRK
jgi:uncharacterized membrane protein YsdA (DUF1294 family)